MRKTIKVIESSESERLAQIYLVAATIFCEKGYDATSMSDIAEAVGITKAGIYHYVKSKQDLLFEIMSFGMETLEKDVITPAKGIADAETRLKAIIANHVRLITEGSTPSGHNPVTIINDEVGGLTAAQRRKIINRKRVYLDLLRETLNQLKNEGKLKDVNITVASFSLFGMLLWVSRWYRSNGSITVDQLVEEMSKIALGGILRPQARLSKK